MTDTIESLRARVAELEADVAEIPQLCRKYERQIAALKAGQGEPVGKIVAATGSLNDAAIIQWTGSYCPVIGDLLYTSAPSIPDGWKLVPVEPTVEMYEDGVYAYELTGFMSRAYEAMLSAAPEYKGEPDWSTQKKWGE